ncbi:MAG TPA: ABC transporter substrate-binding protein [Mycobacteriales bacterium]|nr:ABC transporter substrate-binding protein [Mycobacteriales bacterium]
MSLNKLGLRGGTAVAVVALLAAACGGSSDDKKNTPASGGKGGQLNVFSISDFEHIDPQRTYVATNMNFIRLFTRQLTSYKTGSIEASQELAPDLATDTGTATDGNKTWKFTLKDGLKYEDGSPITTQDIKYGIERSFSPIIDSGPQYFKHWLVGGEAYKGPYDGKELDSIETPDAKTIIFRLSKAHADFNYMAALPTSTPVPKAKDTKANYDARPFSSGPYKIDVYARGGSKGMTLSRNQYWSNDDIRKALPDTIKVTFLDAKVIDSRLIASAALDANAVALDSSVQPENVAAVNSRPDVKSRSTAGATGFLRYIAMNTTKGPLKDVKVRQALEWGINKQDQQTARGGPLAAGDVATTLIAPNLGGFEQYNAYAGEKGDVAKAKQLLAAAGYPNGFTATLTANTTPKGQAQAVAFQASMKKIGVTIKVKSVDSAVFYDTVGDAKNETEFVLAGWGPDWPSAISVIPPLFDGRQIVPTGNQNFSQLNDPALNAEMDRIAAMDNLEEANKAWAALDKKIMTDFAPIFPLLNEKAIFLAGKNVKGAYMMSLFGSIDLSNLSVK